MKNVSVIGKDFRCPPTPEDVRGTTEEVRSSRIFEQQHRVAGVTLEEHRKMMICAAEDTTSISDLIPPDDGSRQELACTPKRPTRGAFAVCLRVGRLCTRRDRGPSFAYW